MRLHSILRPTGRRPLARLSPPGRWRCLAKVSPASRRLRMRSGTVGFKLVGGPRCTPCALRTASASRVRWPLMRRSHCAAVAMTLAIKSPAGVLRSTPMSTSDSRQRTPTSKLCATWDSTTGRLACLAGSSRRWPCGCKNARSTASRRPSARSREPAAWLRPPQPTPQFLAGGTSSWDSRSVRRTFLYWLLRGHKYRRERGVGHRGWMGAGPDDRAARYQGLSGVATPQ